MVSARPRPGQHPLTTDKEACAPNLQRLYFSSSVIRPNKLRSSSAIPEVNVHSQRKRTTYGLGGGDGRGIASERALGWANDSSCGFGHSTAAVKVWDDAAESVAVGVSH